MCDAVIITGLGINDERVRLTPGHLGLQLADHNWQVVIHLALFSNPTHQAALLFLRGYIRKHPRERLWRFCLIPVLVVMIVVALVPTHILRQGRASLQRSDGPLQRENEPYHHHKIKIKMCMIEESSCKKRIR